MILGLVVEWVRWMGWPAFSWLMAGVAFATVFVRALRG